MDDLSYYKIDAPNCPVYIGKEIWSELSALLKPYDDSGQLFILSDENTAELCLPVLKKQLPHLSMARLFILSPGESSKEMSSLAAIWDWLLEERAERKALLLNLGGGVVSDLGGFAAGTYKRGIRYVNVPTTLTGQVDASIGGKTGVNLDGVKNAVGLFCFPVSVFIDPVFLETLPERHINAGYAEVVKSAFLSGSAFWDMIRSEHKINIGTMTGLIIQAASFKCEVVEKDPYENDWRKVLNFGHTMGHALESLSFRFVKKELLHGEAVAAGMICEAFLSHLVTGLPKEELDDLVRLIRSFSILYPIDPDHTHEIIDLISHDKKMSEGLPGFILMEKAGKPSTGHQVDQEQLRLSLEYYNQAISYHGDHQGK